MLNPPQVAQAKQTIDTLAVLIRELPLRDYLAQMKPDDPARATVQAMLGVQATLSPIPPQIHRG